MVDPVLVLTVRVCASAAACVLFASLVPEIRAVQRQNSTASMPSALPMLSMLANCVAWGIYGALIGDLFPLVATNIVGVSLSLFYIVVYYRHVETDRKISLQLQILVTVLLLALLLLYPLVMLNYLNAELEAVQDQVGFVTVAISAVMFGSPLVLVGRVIRQRSTELLPLTMIVTGAINCGLWLTYGLLRADVFVVVMNAANLLLGIVQLTLFIIFPRGSQYDTLEKGTSTPVGVKRKSETTTVETDDETECSEASSSQQESETGETGEKQEVKVEEV